jgi:hypothetical protein
LAKVDYLNYELRPSSTESDNIPLAPQWVAETTRKLPIEVDEEKSATHSIEAINDLISKLNKPSVNNCFE